ncbi:MAG: SAM-dependent methyltransferase [Phycisphaerae bacterium]
MLKRPWYEELFDDMYAAVLGSEAHESKAPQEARCVKRLLRLRKGQRVLDCPCGLGRLSRGLARLGLEVTGADLMDSYVREARRRARREGLPVRFIASDMRDLPFEGEFDAVVNWFTSIGYFDRAGDLAVARAAFAALKPGGCFLVEAMNKSWLLAHWNPEPKTATVGDVQVTAAPRWDARAGVIRDTWVLRRGRARRRRELTLRPYNSTEIRKLLRRAGFRDISLHPNPPGKRFSRHAKRYIAIGTKPRRP